MITSRQIKAYLTNRFEWRCVIMPLIPTFGLIFLVIKTQKCRWGDQHIFIKWSIWSQPLSLRGLYPLAESPALCQPVSRLSPGKFVLTLNKCPWLRMTIVFNIPIISFWPTVIWLDRAHNYNISRLWKPFLVCEAVKTTINDEVGVYGKGHLGVSFLLGSMCTEGVS